MQQQHARPSSPQPQRPLRVERPAWTSVETVAECADRWAAENGAPGEQMRDWLATVMAQQNAQALDGFALWLSDPRQHGTRPLRELLRLSARTTMVDTAFFRHCLFAAGLAVDSTVMHYAVLRRYRAGVCDLALRGCAINAATLCSLVTQGVIDTEAGGAVGPFINWLLHAVDRQDLRDSGDAMLNASVEALDVALGRRSGAGEEAATVKALRHALMETVKVLLARTTWRPNFFLCARLVVTRCVGVLKFIWRSGRLDAAFHEPLARQAVADDNQGALDLILTDFELPWTPALQAHHERVRSRTEPMKCWRIVRLLRQTPPAPRLCQYMPPLQPRSGNATRKNKARYVAAAPRTPWSAAREQAPQHGGEREHEFVAALERSGVKRSCTSASTKGGAPSKRARLDAGAGACDAIRRPAACWTPWTGSVALLPPDGLTEVEEVVATAS